MAIDARKRQKKLERKRAKEKAKRRQLAVRRSGGMASRLQAVAAAPILHCCAMADLWDAGIGEVLIGRRLNNGNVAFGVFLVDMYCLGVKNAFANILPLEEYQDRLYDRLADRSEMIPLKPEAARKLVEGAVQYAADLGFSPHADYYKAKAIFGDISAESCHEEFRYGQDGQPVFANGPFDDMARCHYIINTLTDRLGPDGFRCVLRLDNFGDTDNFGDIDDMMEEDDLEGHFTLVDEDEE
jgi:hypothetical protein